MIHPDTLQTLRIDGMDCAGCAVAVRQALEGVNGVESAEVDFAAGLASVQGVAEFSALTLAVTKAGYRAESIESFEDPRLLRAEVERRQQLQFRAWRWRALVGLSIWVPLESLHWISKGMHMHGIVIDVIMLAGSSLSMVLVGSGFWRSAWAVLRHRRTNMDVLIALGATTAFVASAVTFAAQQCGSLLDQPTWFSEAAALLAIISVGHWMESSASARAGAAVRELLELQPERVQRVESDGTETDIATQDVRPSDCVRVRPGGRIAVDGEVFSGMGDFDESVITGESLPIARGVGEKVFAGTLNINGDVVVRSSVDGRGTSLTRIALQVQRAQSSRAPIQATADRIASIFVPVVLLIALASVIGWGMHGDWATGVLAATTVLIISCPCALGLATPMAIMVGAGEASLRGVLVKDAGALERAGRVEKIWFDKTGTLTLGKPTVERVEVLGNGSEIEAIALAAAAESGSEHPIASAIRQLAQLRKAQPFTCDAFQSLPGMGVRATVRGHDVQVLRDAHASCVVHIDSQPRLRLHITDTVRQEAAAVVRALQAQSLVVGMLTGDRAAEATRVGARVGIHADSIHADLMPADKARMLRESGATAAMVGDGVNDAAALAESCLGIAVGGGVQVAGESAAVVLVGGRLTALPELIGIGRSTLTCIRQNLFMAFVYNALAIPAAAFALLGGHGPAIAAAAMALSDLSVIGNAARLKMQLAVQRRRVRVDRSPKPAA